ncbi:hypothetical protein XHV734_2514 [Xanthomonas hortorum pv. vitians]|nr:hypothetical protein XHV734_2514 [Xanthomonas hortorum pv. vitians]
MPPLEKCDVLWSRSLRLSSVLELASGVLILSRYGLNRKCLLARFFSELQLTIQVLEFLDSAVKQSRKHTIGCIAAFPVFLAALIRRDGSATNKVNNP